MHLAMHITCHVSRKRFADALRMDSEGWWRGRESAIAFGVASHSPTPSRISPLPFPLSRSTTRLSSHSCIVYFASSASWRESPFHVTNILREDRTETKSFTISNEQIVTKARKAFIKTDISDVLFFSNLLLAYLLDLFYFLFRLVFYIMILSFIFILRV